jgi:nitrogen-specific signal transduction histidine kinase/CheY-like chemotaxis protein
VSASLLRDASGSPLYFICHIQDITAQKKAQLESQSLEAQLQHAQKMEAIGTLAAGIAHDFNNVLSAIMGYTELALMDSAEPSIQESLEKVMQAGSRAADLIKQILAFSRQDEGKMEPVQLSSIVKEALKLLRSTIPPHIAIVQNISNEPLVVNAQPTQIHQLVMNLCTNAYHAMMTQETGTLTVSLAPEAARAPETGEARVDLKLTIADTGCGMSPDVRARIFEPYFTTKRKGMGTGLGLSIVHGIVQKHEGEIRVESAPGKGTAFEIRFPTVAPLAAPAEAVAADLPQGREGVLIVDDEREVATICREMLRRQGYAVESKTDPYEALDEFRQNPDRYQLVITDYSMPGMTGERLTAELARIRPQLPVILCTGYFEQVRDKPLPAAIKECILKPVTMGKLAETVRRVIDRGSAAPAGH